MKKTIYYPLVCHSRPDVYRDKLRRESSFVQKCLDSRLRGNDKEKVFLKFQYCNCIKTSIKYK